MAEYTTNFNLKKPAQDDFYNVDDFNENMDIIDENMGNFHKTRSMKTFTSLNEIGLTAGSETIADIVNALPDGSALMVGTDGNHNMSIYPNEHYGLMVVFKRTTARTMFLYSSYGSGFYYGYYYSVNNDWSGWQSFLKMTGGTLTGNVKINHVQPALELTDTSNNGGSKIHKNAGTDIDYGTYISDIDENGIQDILILRRAGSTNADKLLLRIYNEDGTSSETYKIYHEGNKPTAADLDVLSCAGGTVRSAITFQKANINNGSGRIIKNHSADADYGMVITDYDADGDSAALIIQARLNNAYFSPVEGGTYKLYSEYNKPTADDVGAVSKKLLWSNASPTSAFPAQTLNIDITGYDELEVEYRISNTLTRTRRERVRPGVGAVLYNIGNIDASDAFARIYQRAIAINYNTLEVTVEAAKSKQLNLATTLGDNTYWCIPTKIWGIKGVQ